MAIANSTRSTRKTSSPNAHNPRQLGAMAAAQAMAELEKIAEFYDTETDTAQRALRNEQQAIKSVTEAAGHLSPFLSGFIEAMAEYLYWDKGGCTYDLSAWKPEAAMSDDEVAGKRQWLQDIYTKKPTDNVIHFPSATK
jgi:hypothetical protein